MDKLYFAKVRQNAIIPSKREEDAGYDVYACFDEDEIVISPGEIKFIPTGIATAFPSDYVLLARERGSTGSKGLAVRCGVIDSGYRDEIFIPINNTTDKIIIISKDIEKTKRKVIRNEIIILGNEYSPSLLDRHYTFYPYSKAIAQLILVPVPKVEVKELSYEELSKIKSERGTGKLGSTNK